MKSFLTKMLVEETRGQRVFIREETVLVNIVISEFYEPHSLIEQEKDFTHCPNLSKSSWSSCDKMNKVRGSLASLCAPCLLLPGGSTQVPSHARGRGGGELAST